MTWLLGLLSPRVWIGIGLSIAVGFLAALIHRDGFKAGALSVQVVLEKEPAQAATATAEWQAKARAADEQARNTERTWLEAARSIDRDGIQTAEKLRTAVARADLAGVGLC